MKALAPLFAIVGIAMLGFGLHIARNGAEPTLPPPERAVEGVVVTESTIRGPVGEPFTFGEVRVSAADAHNPQDTHYRRTFGDARITLRTADGETTVDLPNPASWKVAEGVDESIETQTLEGQRLIGNVDPDDRIAPPYAIRVRAVRAGDRIILEQDDGGQIVRAFVGDRAALVAARERAEGMRWPAVGVIVVMGIVSLAVAYRLAMGRTEAGD